MANLPNVSNAITLESNISSNWYFFVL
jgi:hypothetical protein